MTAPLPLPRAPKDVDEALLWLQLSRAPRVGPVTFRRLLAEHGTAKAALAVLPEIAAAAGLKTYRLPEMDGIEREYRAGKRMGARLLALGSSVYPAALADIETAPALLWAVGRLDLAQKPAIGVVGARNASALGVRTAQKFARDLGQAGHVIVSGLARGIDAAAHQAALETGTIAVLGTGVDVVYPPETAALTEAIRRDGLCLSEFPMGSAPHASHFPRRNRVISGLSRALVVIEAAVKSGSLITASDALDQGREVMAVPAHPFDGRAGGCNQLIRDGAVLVRSAEDVLAALPALVRAAPPDAAVPKTAPPAASAQAQAGLHAAILDALRGDPVAEDDVGLVLNLPSDTVALALTELELSGAIARYPGGLVGRRA